MGLNFYIRQIVEEFSKSIDLERQFRALKTTTDYVEKNLSNVISVSSLFEVHDVAIKEISINSYDGIIAEFGVYTGKTINHIAKNLPNYKVYGFDSFQGLPEFWRDGFDKGTFKLEKLPEVESNVELVVGLFEKTLPRFLKNENRKIAYLHVDCDLYSSIKTVFNYLKDRIVSGTVIVFDEYFNYPGWEEGEFKAFQEFIKETGKEYKYLTYNRKHEQVAVKIIKG